MLSLPAISQRSTAADRFVVALALLLPTAVTWLYFIALDGAPARLQQGAYGIGKTIQFALPAFWVLAVQRRREGLEIPRSWAVIAGSVFGIAVAAAMAALYFLVLEPAGLFVEPGKAVKAKVESFGAGSPVAFLFLALFYSAIHSLLEEYYWRWFVFGRLRREISVPTAAVLSALAFSAHHFVVLQHLLDDTLLAAVFSAGICAGGVIWAWQYHRTRSLPGVWLSHLLVDIAALGIGHELLSA